MSLKILRQKELTRKTAMQKATNKPTSYMFATQALLGALGASGRCSPLGVGWASLRGGGVSNLGGGIILDWGLRAGVNLSVAMPSKLFLDL